MISQFFILSARGDTIISREYRGDIVKGSAELFFSHVKSVKGACEPVFNLDGVHFLFIRQSALYFVVTTRSNVSPGFTLELLARLAKLFKDYCGVLTEEAIRKNFVLIYELLDETLDFGYPQSLSTEVLKAYVHEEAVLVEETSGPGTLEKLNWGAINKKTISSKASNKPITLSVKKSRSTKNEIFVDLLERLTVLFAPGGSVLKAEVDGALIMKSYLQGNPELRLALNEDLVIGKGGGFGRVTLDDINFHECVNPSLFEMERSLSFFPPDGEFCVLNYRISDDFNIPFRIFPFVEEMEKNRVDVVVKVRADLPEGNYGTNVEVRFPVPKTTNGVNFELSAGASGGQKAVYISEPSKQVLWTMNKFKAGQEHLLRAKLTLPHVKITAVRKEIGPISMDFEIPMYNCSNVQIRYLRVMERGKAYEPYRWIRYITQAHSYIARIGAS